MSKNPFSDSQPNPYEPPAVPLAAANSDEVARLAVKLKVQPVAIVLMTMAALNVPFMIYMFAVHYFIYGRDQTFLLQMYAVDAAMTLTTLVMLYGANQFRLLGNRKAARMAAVLACIPFCSPCLFLGIPIGMWGLMVLGRAEVRGAFAS